ncbi:UNVERIFIED_ORG: hypothetical protein ABID57_000653 [Arthrobacter sp. UYEF1]
MAPEKLHSGLPLYFGLEDSHLSPQQRRYDVIIVRFDLSPDIRGLDEQTIRKNGTERDIARFVAEFLAQRYFDGQEVAEEVA